MRDLDIWLRIAGIKEQEAELEKVEDWNTEEINRELKIMDRVI